MPPSPLPGKVPEILAPAGGRAQFFAALNAGADAVYLGLKEFNARARAENFTLEDLRELLPLARRYGLKVLVTVNVLIKNEELPRLVDCLGHLEAAGVDAIIVQDLAVARLARDYFPSLRLHASTQMAVHNLAGVREAQRHGFRRVVLARELTAKEIQKIREAVPAAEMEIEAFCHGSLCYSYSGLCFFSGANDARSGNRGECAYTCREPYKILNEPGEGFLFSMRDLDTSQSLATLCSTGVDTLKIEGRKKDAQYVSTVVKLYRSRLDELYGASTLRPEAPATAREKVGDVRHDLALSFHRQPTNFFLEGRYVENVIDLDNPTHLGLRVGAIRSVKERRVSLSTEQDLERFDGLRLMSADLLAKYENQGVQFSLQEMWVHGKRSPVAPAGARVELEWPTGEPLPSTGEVLYKVRSADLKRRVHRLELPPPDERLRALDPVEVLVTLAEEATGLRVSAAVRKLGQSLTEASILVEKAAPRGEPTLARDLTEHFAVFGEEGFQAISFHVDGDPQKCFVPRSRLKELKRDLAEGLRTRYEAFLSERRSTALKAISAREPAPLPFSARFAVKLDRLEALEDLAAFLSAHPEFPLKEVVFEPKRAFLPALKPQALGEALVGFQNASGVPVRLAFPMVIRAWDEPLLRMLFEKAGLRRFEVGNLGALRLLEEWKLPTEDLAGDFTLYALNHEATRFWAERGITQIALSLEDDETNLHSHLGQWPWGMGIRPQAILYKDTPLFIAEACSLTALHGGCPTAKVCGYRTLEVENPKGEKFFVAHESCKSIVYADEAYSLTQVRKKLSALGIGDFRLDFLTRPYPRERLHSILSYAWREEAVPQTHTANFHRSLL